MSQHVNQECQFNFRLSTVGILLLYLPYPKRLVLAFVSSHTLLSMFSIQTLQQGYELSAVHSCCSDEIHKCHNYAFQVVHI